MWGTFFGKKPSVVPVPLAPPPAYPSELPVASTLPQAYTNADWNAAMNRAIKEETEGSNVPTSINTIPVVSVTESMLKHNMMVVLSKSPIHYISGSAAKYKIALVRGYPKLRSRLTGNEIDGEFSVDDGILRFIDQRTTTPLHQRRYYVYTFAEGGRRRSRGTGRRASRRRGTRRRASRRRASRR
jgi:hypothetical protein